MASYIYRTLLAIFTALLGSKYATAMRTDLCNRSSVYPNIVDTSHSSPAAAKFFHGYYTAKSLHNAPSWLSFFNPNQLSYYDATLGEGWSNFSSFQASIIPLVQSWPPDNAASYPLLILGDTNSAVVHYVDMAALFGAELRIILAINFENGTVIRQVDYWDGRQSAATKGRPPPAHRQLSAAFTSGNSIAAAELFAYDAIFEDTTLRARLEGQLAVGNYLQRALSHLPYGPGSKVRHTLGSSQAGGYEWESDLPLLNGITALELDCNGLITKLMTVWDGSRMNDTDIKTLVSFAIE